MTSKNDLAKMALAGLLLAAVMPMDGNAQGTHEVKGSFIAMAKCDLHGCGGKPDETPPPPANKKVVPPADSTTPKTLADNFDDNYDNRSQDRSMNMNSRQSDRSSNMNNRESDRSSNMNNRSTNRSSRDDDRGIADMGGMQNNYNTNRGMSSGPDYNDSNANAAANTVKPAMTKTDLFRQLNPQGRAIFAGMDEAGQQLALDLASGDSYKDKNEAVKEAQKRIKEQQSISNPQ